MAEAPYIEVPPKGKGNTGKTLGIIGTVIGGLGLCAGVACAGLGYVLAIAALVLGIIGLMKGKEDDNPQTAKILGIVATALGALTLLISCANSLVGAYLGMTGQINWEELLRQFQP